jgi:uncharacterized membrane protein
MSGTVFHALLLGAAIGSGLSAGVFFAFSSFVMSGLQRLPAVHAIAAMQAINVTAVTPLFMTALFGTGLVCLVLLAGVGLGWSEARGGPVAAGSLVYLAGIVGVTLVFNVPLNNALAVLDPASAQGATTWATYLKTWVMWNHVRTVAGLAALACFIVAARG